MTIQSVMVRDEVTITYIEANQQAGKEDRYKIVSAEEPRPELRASLINLSPHVCEMLQLEHEYADGMTIQKVSITRKGSTKLYTISGIKELNKSNSTFKFTTPPRADMVKEGSNDSELPKEVITMLQALEKEAELYLKGHRSQAELDFSSEEEE